MSFTGATPTLRVWAPTAQSVRLYLFDDANAGTPATVFDMTAAERWMAP